ncbi:MAG: hypothetical protein ACK5LO_07835 [Leucobacter sp.]
MRKIIIFLIAALFGVASLSVVSGAHADPPSSIGPPDTGMHTWCGPDPSKWLYTLANNAASGAANQTVVDVAYQASCSSTTDVKWAWESSSTAAYGSAQCMIRRSNGRCDQYKVLLYKKAINASPHPSSQERKTSCHELGHTLGVSHYSGSSKPGGDTSHSCLRSGKVPNPNKSWHTKYGTHHKTVHINPWFS